MNVTTLKTGILVRDYFSREEIANFLSNQQTKNLHKSGIQSDGYRSIDEGIRNSMQVSVNIDNPFINKLRECVTQLNAEYLGINLTNVCKENQFVEYWETGKFEAHTDIIWPSSVFKHDENPVRKLTTVVLLSDEFTGGKLALWEGKTRYSFEFNVGDIVAFPAYIRHQVDPVEDGVRYSLVSWSYGEF